MKGVEASAPRSRVVYPRRQSSRAGVLATARQRSMREGLAPLVARNVDHGRPQWLRLFMADVRPAMRLWSILTDRPGRPFVGLANWASNAFRYPPLKIKQYQTAAQRI